MIKRIYIMHIPKHPSSGVMLSNVQPAASLKEHIRNKTSKLAKLRYSPTCLRINDEECNPD